MTYTTRRNILKRRFDCLILVVLSSTLFISHTERKEAICLVYCLCHVYNINTANEAKNKYKYHKFSTCVKKRKKMFKFLNDWGCLNELNTNDNLPFVIISIYHRNKLLSFTLERLLLLLYNWKVCIAHTNQIRWSGQSGIQFCL